jgi:uncharacterized protein
VELLLTFVAVLVGAVVQGSVGFGLALVVVPVLALIRPEVLPAVVLLLTMPMATLMVVREWRSADVAGLLPILGGRVLGTLGGVGSSRWSRRASCRCCSAPSCWRPCSRASCA